MVTLFGNGSAAGTSAVPDVAGPTALNAGTTYGADLSAANNYGFGKHYMSGDRLLDAKKKKDAAPSVWWMIGFFVLGACLL